MNGKERKWAARDAADERRGNIPPKPPAITQTCQCDQLRLDFDAEIRERRAAVCERDEAIRERDEARRWFCRAGFKTERAARAKASKRNWDCFKDETQ